MILFHIRLIAKPLSTEIFLFTRFRSLSDRVQFKYRHVNRVQRRNITYFTTTDMAIGLVISVTRVGPSLPSLVIIQFTYAIVLRLPGENENIG